MKPVTEAEILSVLNKVNSERCKELAFKIGAFGIANTVTEWEQGLRGRLYYAITSLNGNAIMEILDEIKNSYSRSDQNV